MGLRIAPHLVTINLKLHNITYQSDFGEALILSFP